MGVRGPASLPQPVGVLRKPQWKQNAGPEINFESFIKQDTRSLKLPGWKYLIILCNIYGQNIV